MDVHTRIENTPIILEVFTQRIPSKKQEQLDNYVELYQTATGFEPDSYLITDWVWDEDEDRSEDNGIGRDGEYTIDYFFDHIEQEYGIEPAWVDSQAPISEFTE